MDRTVYLAGPIKGLSYGECTSWRRWAKDYLDQFGITAYSPMRGRDYLRNDEVINDVYPEHALSTAHAIIARDKHDVLTCSCLLANLLGAKTISVGTTMEIAWAALQNKPIILVMEKNGNPHHHPFITEHAGFWVQDLKEACDIVRYILLPE